MSTTKKIPFEIPGADGGPLRGEVRTSGGGADRPAVVLCHGFQGFKDWGFFPILADRLSRAGLTSVSINFGSSGVGNDGETYSEPDRFGHGTISNDVADLDRVLGALASGKLIRGMGPVASYGLFGHGRGGATTVLYAAAHDTVRALVTWAATARAHRWNRDTVTRWRANGSLNVESPRTGEALPLYVDLLDDVERKGATLDAVNVAGRIGASWLIVHGADDESVPADEARQLYEASSKQRCRLVMIPDTGHTYGVSHPWRGNAAPFEAACDATVGWFADKLF